MTLGALATTILKPWQSIFVTPRGLRCGLPRRYASRNDARSARNDYLKAVAVYACNTA